MERDRQSREGVKTESALQRGLRVGEVWARSGFDWSDVQGPRDKLDEEIRELDEALSRRNAKELERELGDVLFAVVNLGRHIGVDPEAALDQTLDRLERRFSGVERRLEASGRRATECTIDELEAFWQSAKHELETNGDD